MATQVIVLNGGSSSGKSGIVRCLKHLLPEPWISLGIDDLIERLPPATVTFGPQGEVILGDGFDELQHAWRVGVAAMARAGARIIIDEVLLGGGASQEQARRYLDGLTVLWVGVRCAADIAAAREIARGDRVVGMAAAQAEIVHQGVGYDIEVDTSHLESLDCARMIAARVISAPKG
jgi:chloramphenicol 3-O phosphotransferase